MENDAFSDKSERDNIEESENEAHENSRKTNESESDQSEIQGEVSPGRKGTTYIEQVYEEFGEVRKPDCCLFLLKHICSQHLSLTHLAVWQVTANFMSSCVLQIKQSTIFC